MSNVMYTLMFVMVAVATLGSFQVSAQSYHFSNGWNPGKRSSSGAAQQEVCHFRTDVKSLVFKLIEDEVFRMLTDPTCYSSVPTLRNLLKKDMGYQPIDRS